MPVGIKRDVRTLSDRIRAAQGEQPRGEKDGVLTLADLPRDEALRMIKDLESQMRRAAKELEYEKAAQLRDQIVELRRALVE